MMRIFIALLLFILPGVAFGAERHILIDKPAYMLYVIEKTDTIFKAPVGLGKYKGNKQRRGDNKTPEGTFSVCQIQDAKAWTHDFRDGKGETPGAYGPWFIRLKMPKWTSIGIHGTCFPNSIGKRDSEGCIRLRNEDLEKLKPLVQLGMKVIITPDKL